VSSEGFEPKQEPQVAWKAIEADAEVFSTEGENVGKVAQVVGDPDADVFTGLSISLGVLGADRFVESERVRGIWPDRVELELTVQEIEALPEYDEQPSERLASPDDFMTRLRRLFGFYGRRGPRA
jgi:sporulation protein YlmC with PRC-barrel domain